MSDDIVERLREEGFITHMARLTRESKLLHEAADEIERLQKERDEARREVCEWVSLATRPNEKSPRHIAEQRGWYIYNQREDNNA